MNWITIQSENYITHIRADYAAEVNVGPGRKYATIEEWERDHVRKWEDEKE